MHILKKMNILYLVFILNRIFQVMHLINYFILHALNEKKFLRKYYIKISEFLYKKSHSLVK